VAAEDPSALFGLLGPLPLDPPAPPAPRLAEPARSAGGRLVRALVAGAAAATIAAACLLVAVRSPEGVDAGRGIVAEARRPVIEGRFGSTEGVSRVVRRLDSRTARVITVVPESAEDPTVTLILDEEIDL
jgi:hypothetical protein